jgi:hypothetical protein
MTKQLSHARRIEPVAHKARIRSVLPWSAPLTADRVADGIAHTLIQRETKS